MRKVVVGLLAMCVGLAFLKMLVTALLVGSATLLMFGFITRTGQTLVFLGTVLVVGLASARPATFIVVVGIIALAVVAIGAWGRPRRHLLLTDNREDRSPSRLDRDLLG